MGSFTNVALPKVFLITLSQLVFSVPIWAILRLPVSASFSADVVVAAAFGSVVLLVAVGTVFVDLFRWSEGRLTLQLPEGGTTLVCLLTGAILACATFGSTEGGNYATTLAPELALVGRLHQDTLFHTAIANMILHEGIQSVGMDGLLPLGYHTLSHRVVGYISYCAGIPVILGYTLILPLILLPLLNFAFMRCLVLMRPEGYGGLGDIPAILGGLALVYLLSAFAGSHFLSESHAMAMTFALLALPFILHLPVSTGPIVWNLARVAWVPIAVLLTSQAKISVGAVLACGFAWALFIVPGNLLRRAAVGFVLSIVPFFLVFFLNRQASEIDGTNISIFHFLIHFPMFTLIHWLVFFIAFVFLFFNFSKIALPWVQALIVMILVSLVSSQIFVMGSAAYYFLNPGLWFACIVIAISAKPVDISNWTRARQTIVVMTILVVCIVADSNRQRAVKLYSADVAATADRNATSIALVVSWLNTQDLPKGTAVVIPPQVDGFWNSQVRFPCWAPSFLIPALAGVPMLNGLAPEPCEIIKFYGFSAYDFAKSRSRNMADSELCSKAIGLQLSKLAIFDEVDNRVIDCGNAAKSKSGQSYADR